MKNDDPWKYSLRAMKHGWVGWFRCWNLWNHSWSVTRNTNDKKDNFVVSSNYLQARFSLSHQINKVSRQTVIASLFFRCVKWKIVCHIYCTRTCCYLRHACFVRTKLHRSMNTRVHDGRMPRLPLKDSLNDWYLHFKRLPPGDFLSLATRNTHPLLQSCLYFLQCNYRCFLCWSRI